MSVASHTEQILLCHMNSGNTSPWAHPRSFSSFSRIEDYTTKRNGTPAKPVAELVIDYEVSDIRDHVVNVRRMKGTLVLKEDDV